MNLKSPWRNLFMACFKFLIFLSSLPAFLPQIILFNRWLNIWLCSMIYTRKSVDTCQCYQGPIFKEVNILISSIAMIFDSWYGQLKTAQTTLRWKVDELYWALVKAILTIWGKTSTNKSVCIEFNIQNVNFMHYDWKINFPYNDELVTHTTEFYINLTFLNLNFSILPWIFSPSFTQLISK